MSTACTPTKSSSVGVSWRRRLRHELTWSYTTYSLEEPRNDEDESCSSSKSPRPCVDIRQCIAPYRPIIKATFCSVPSCFSPLNDRTFYIRCVFLLTSLHVFYVDLKTYPPHNLWVYMFYLTHWGHCANVVYLLCSLLSCVVLRFSSKADRLIKLTWSLYSTASPLALATTLLYWTAIAPTQTPDAVNYVSIMEHGGISALVLLDGVVVGNIPVRAKHFVKLLSVCIAYLLWSIINYALHIGSGEWGPTYEDDAIYPVLNWNTESRLLAAMISGFAIIVLCPAMFWVVWMLSLVSVEDVKSDSDSTTRSTTSCCDFCCCFCCRTRRKCLVWKGNRRPVLNDDGIFASTGLHHNEYIEMSGGGGAPHVII